MKGNKKSLVDAAEKGIDLRKQILKLYKDYYHGGLMKLVVIGGGKFLFCAYLVVSLSLSLLETILFKVELHLFPLIFIYQTSASIFSKKKKCFIFLDPFTVFRHPILTKF